MNRLYQLIEAATYCGDGPLETRFRKAVKVFTERQIGSGRGSLTWRMITRELGCSEKETTDWYCGVETLATFIKGRRGITWTEARRETIRAVDRVMAEVDGRNLGKLLKEIGAEPADYGTGKWSVNDAWFMTHARAWFRRPGPDRIYDVGDQCCQEPRVTVGTWPCGMWQDDWWGEGFSIQCTADELRRFLSAVAATADPNH